MNSEGKKPRFIQTFAWNWNYPPWHLCSEFSHETHKHTTHTLQYNPPLVTLTDIILSLNEQWQESKELISSDPDTLAGDSRATKTQQSFLECVWLSSPLPPQQKHSRWDSFRDKWLQRAHGSGRGLWDICQHTCQTPDCPTKHTQLQRPGLLSSESASRTVQIELQGPH